MTSDNLLLFPLPLNLDADPLSLTEEPFRVGEVGTPAGTTNNRLTRGNGEAGGKRSARVSLKQSTADFLSC